MRNLAMELEDPAVGAAQGYYVTDRGAGLCARAMSLDLEQRYAAITSRDTGHACTGNTAYRADALRRVGLFDEALGYGYDNDISYRLCAAGYRLTLSREARSVHRWRDGIAGYLVQQYGFGYGRVDLVAKHPRRVGGDTVSPAAMMSHPVLMAVALAAFAIATLAAAVGGPWRPMAIGAAGLVGALALERLAAGVSAAWRFRSLTPLVFPALHLARDLAWVAAIVVWTVRRTSGRRSKPAHSMRPRPEIAP
jgi:glycosyl transferase family 2